MLPQQENPSTINHDQIPLMYDSVLPELLNRVYNVVRSGADLTRYPFADALDQYVIAAQSRGESITRVALGKGQVFLISDITMARQVMGSDRDYSLTELKDNLPEIVGRGSVTTEPDSPHWKAGEVAAKRTIQRGNLPNLEAKIENIARTYVNRLVEKGPVDIGKDLKANFSAEIMNEIIFSNIFQPDELNEVVTFVLDSARIIPDQNLKPGLRDAKDRGPIKKLMQRKIGVDQLMKERISAHLNKIDSGEIGEQNDFYGEMRAFYQDFAASHASEIGVDIPTDSDSMLQILAEQTRIMLLAGVETTPPIGAGAIFELARDPELFTRLKNQLQEVGTDDFYTKLQNDAYPDLSDLLVKLFHKYNSALAINRRTKGPLSLKDSKGRTYNLPQDAEIFIPARGLTNYYFLQGMPFSTEYTLDTFTPPRVEQGQKALYRHLKSGGLPLFGAGARTCWGIDLAPLMIAHMVKEFLQQSQDLPQHSGTLQSVPNAILSMEGFMIAMR